MPEILDNINLIIMENDYHILEQKNILITYSQKGVGPCRNNFYEVWKKTAF